MPCLFLNFLWYLLYWLFILFFWCVFNSSFFVGGGGGGGGRYFVFSYSCFGCFSSEEVCKLTLVAGVDCL